MTQITGCGTRILIAAKFFTENYGGTPESILLLARNLASIGVACDIVTPRAFIRNAHCLPALPQPNHSTVGECPNISNYAGLFIAGPWNFQAVGISIRARRAKVPITYAAKGGLGSGDFTRIRDIKKIPYFLVVEIFLLLWARTIIFSSPIERDNCIVPRFLWKNKYAVLPEPFEPAPAISVRKPASPALILGFLAEIRALKGLSELVEAMVLLKDRLQTTPLRLRIAGSPRPGSQRYLDSIRAFSVRQGFSEQLEWLGGVRGAENRADFYESLDIFVCPSKTESFGLTPLEALWHGVPVAIGPEVGVRAYIPKEAPVAVFEKVEAESIASTLLSLISRRDDLRERAMAWRGQVLPDLAGERLARKFLEILRAG